MKGGTLWDFLTSIVLQNVETNEGGPFGAIQKVSKKSHSAEKWGYGGILSVISRFWTSVLLFSFWTRFWGSKLLRFDVVEQMNKKVDLTRLKNNKTRTSKVGAISKAQKAQNNFLEKNLKFLKKFFLSKKVA